MGQSEIWMLCSQAPPQPPPPSLIPIVNDIANVVLYQFLAF